MKEEKKEWKKVKNFMIFDDFVRIIEETSSIDVVCSQISTMASANQLTTYEKIDCIRYILTHRFFPYTKDVHENAAKVFFSIVPVWIKDHTPSNLLACTHDIFMQLSVANTGEHSIDTRNFFIKVRKFVQSYLNSWKEKEIDKELVAMVLINHKMFEELVNYNFVSDDVVLRLCGLVFFGQGYSCNPCYALERSLRGLRSDGSVFKFKEQVKQMLLSWDKVENRHALATLHTLLAMRGDLQKIFGEKE